MQFSFGFLGGFSKIEVISDEWYLVKFLAIHRKQLAIEFIFKGDDCLCRLDL